MDNTCSLKLLFLFTCTFFLSSCAEEGILTPNSGGTTGGTTGVNSYPNLVLKSHFSEKIALVDGSGDARFRVVGLSVSDTSPQTIIVEGNADTVGTAGVFDDNVFIYRADSVGQTALNPAASSDEMDISTDGTKLLHSNDDGKLAIINPATMTIQQIGSSLSFTTSWRGAQISDDGSLIAFVSDADLTGNNPSTPSTVDQLYTLTTDGNNAIKQVTSFTSYIGLQYNSFALSGDGSIIFFTNDNDLMADGSNADGNDEIFSINPDGTNLKQITDTTTVGSIDEIKSDANGSTVVFHLYDIDFGNSLYTVDTSTGTTTFVSFFESTSTGSAETWDQFNISSDGSTIFYSTGEKDTSMDYIYSANGDGSNITLLLTNDTNRIKAPHPSADGSSVTFYSQGDFGKTSIGDSHYQVYPLTP